MAWPVGKACRKDGKKAMFPKPLPWYTSCINGEGASYAIVKVILPNAHIKNTDGLDETPDRHS